MSKTFQFGNGEWAVGKETALAYNDENSNFKPLPFTFDRGSIGTVVNKQGLIETVGVDEPRIDFLNNTKGHLLLEPQRSNQVTYSEDLTQGVNLLYTVVTANSTTSPDGSVNADKLVAGTTNGLQLRVMPTTSLISGNTYTFSTFVKNSGGNYIVFYINDSTSQGMKVNLINQTFTIMGSSTNHFIENYNNGWLRIGFTRTIDQNSSGVNLVPSLDGNNVSFLGDGVNGIFCWGIQAEAASYPTSYIPTQGSAVTRSAETCNGAGNSNVFNDSEGVLYAEFAALTEGGTSRRITISDGDTSNRVVIENDEQSGRYRFFISGGGTTITLTHKTGVTEKNYNKIAVSWNGANSKVYFNGEKTTPETTDTPTISGLSVLQLQNSQATGSNLEGKVKDVRVYNTALTDAELIALTS